jgi:fructokinase
VDGAGPLRFGVDLGGTKTEIAVLAEDEVMLRNRTPTPGSYEGSLDAIAGLLAEAEARAGVRAAAVGVGTPGSLSPATGLIRNANSTRLNGRPLDRDLAQRLGRPVRLANDADCFALAEARAGAGRGAASVFGVILGTGVGGGIVAGGRLLAGPNAIAGEWGHNALPRPGPDETPGPECWCGRRGCIEAWCSGPGLAADHARRTGERAGAEEIAARAAAGDNAAAETLARHLDRLGRALAGVVNVLDPEVIVLGGGLSNMAGLAEGLPEAMRSHVFSDCLLTLVRRHALGDSAGVIGAAWLWRADELEAA